MIDTLDGALDRLLHDADLRRRFAEGERLFSLDDEDAAALGGVDVAQLDAMAAMVCEQVWRSSHRGGTTLARSFEATVAAWRREHPDDVDCAQMVERFVASPAFEAHRPSARGQRGTSIEEAFYAWCSREAIGDDRTRAREFMAAMARALTVCPDPEFRVPDVFRRVPGGWCAVLRGDPPWLFAAVRGRCVTGAITALVARLLEGEAPHVDDAPVAAELRAMGLLG